MVTRFEGQKPFDGLAEQQKANDLVKLIRKLRWMGVEDEAEQMQMKVASCDVQTMSSVIAGPDDTD
jgi:hypothetical protein